MFACELSQRQCRPLQQLAHRALEERHLTSFSQRFGAANHRFVEGKKGLEILNLQRGKMALRHRFSCVIKPSVPRPQTNRLRRRWIGENAFLWGGHLECRALKAQPKINPPAAQVRPPIGANSARISSACGGAPERRARGAGAAAAPK